ncbi:hypothetical protein LSA41_002911 [Escherichia coli]|nr:hypothetical protein [Escherichia coli]
MKTDLPRKLALSPFTTTTEKRGSLFLHPLNICPSVLVFLLIHALIRQEAKKTALQSAATLIQLVGNMLQTIAAKRFTAPPLANL